TELESQLQVALRESETRDDSRKSSMVTMQATVILQNVYIDRAQEKLQSQADQQGKKKKRRVFGDGLPKLLDGAQFFSEVVEYETTQEREAAAKQARAAEKDAYQAQVQEWEKQVDARKKRVDAQRAQYQAALAEWE
ncbi:uncharacterized protein TRAVEDRAFT_94548, partial [Trametes versicolor FP-101664 SS1]|uniref:uncharacterized protein n=1 Tax=Trametes versicolor (strain FP-101664) TaxID=717944 RepID=UPI0004622D88